MLIGFLIVPIVSFFTKKPETEHLNRIFRPFMQLNDAVETAVEGYLTKPHESTARRPEISEDALNSDQQEGAVRSLQKNDVSVNKEKSSN